MEIKDRYTLGEAAGLLEQYPYFTLPALRALKESDLQNPEAAALAARVAITLGSVGEMNHVLGRRAGVFADFYPQPRATTPSTADTIDSFLATYGKAAGRETEALEKLIFNPTPEYGAMLVAEAEKTDPLTEAGIDGGGSEQDRLINSFILGSRTPSPKQEEMPQESPVSKKPVAAQSKTPLPPKESENGSLTEGFVRILIKNRNYRKAIEIISDLHLKNPEKSIYFADQIRFLQKLIINENKK